MRENIIILEENDELVQTTRKPGRGRLKKLIPNPTLNIKGPFWNVRRLINDRFF